MVSMASVVRADLVITVPVIMVGQGARAVSTQVSSQQ